VWIRKGIQARRTRNEGRVRALEALRNVRRDRRDRAGEVKMEIQEAQRTGRLVIEARQLDFQYGSRTVIRDFSTMIMRGDRVGLIGPNGSGKTTLLRLLLGDLPPQSGTVRHGTHLEVAYFDQLHAQLDETKSVRENVRDGSDTVTINGQSRHIIGYLEDFLFTPEQAGGPVARLSGGERNRLLLARLFTRPSNVLVMDEPTNDLDLETLELLQERLADYAGTVLLVSHDRDFLDRVVTSVIAAEGDGRWVEYAGGYSDMLAQRGPRVAPSRAAQAAVARPRPAMPQPVAEMGPQQVARPRRMTFKDRHALETLPARIAALQAETARLSTALADPDFYARDPGRFAATTAALAAAQEALAAAEEQWLALEMLREEIGG
jgi:ATP-binding cassette subfamily F protein uup